MNCIVRIFDHIIKFCMRNTAFQQNPLNIFSLSFKRFKKYCYDVV